MKRIIEVLLLSITLCSCTAQSLKEEPKDLAGLTKVALNLHGYEDEAKMASLGSYYIAYKDAGLSFIDGLGQSEKCIEYAYIYVVKNGKATIIGKIIKYAIYDANMKAIKKIDETDQIYKQIVGLSQDVLIDPFSVGLVLKKDNGKLIKTDPYVMLKVNVSNATIVVFEPVFD